MANISYIGASNLIGTNGTAPGAITPHASTALNDLCVFIHWSKSVGGNETVTIPSGFNQVFNAQVTGRGLLAVGWRLRQSGDTTYTAQGVTNHATGTTGDSIVEWIETFRGTHLINPIVQVTAALSNWASSTTLGAIAAPNTATVHPGDMVLVIGGRMENITGQTVLAGDNLTWATRTINNTTQGSDCGAVSQTGLNGTGSNQTITAKSITTTGTAAVGSGIMLIIETAPDPIADSQTETVAATETESANLSTPASKTESVTVTETQSANNEAVVSLTENVSGADTQAAVITTGVSQTETVSASDTQTAGLELTSEQTEDVSNTETQSATVDTSASQTETVSSTETQMATQDVVAGQEESIVPTEEQLSVIITNSSQEETVNVTDVQTNILVAEGSIVEEVNIYGTGDATVDISVSITETISATEEQDSSVILGGGGSLISASLTETVVVTDISSATVVSLVPTPNLQSSLRPRGQSITFGAGGVNSISQARIQREDQEILAVIKEFLTWQK